MSLLDELHGMSDAELGELGIARQALSPQAPEAAAFAIERTSVPASQVDAVLAERDARDGEDFTAFWSARGRRGAILRNVVPGVDVEVPAELPLVFEVEARRLANDRSLDAVHHLFGLLYGPGTLDQLIAGGLTGEQLGVLLLWGAANGSGRVMSLADATAEFERMKAAQAAGKAPAPLSGSGPTSAGIGGASRQTSHANTGSRKKKSRR